VLKKSAELYILELIESKLRLSNHRNNKTCFNSRKGLRCYLANSRGNEQAKAII
jgi:hypothetical protein